MVFCNILGDNVNLLKNAVTILILIDGFLQFVFKQTKKGENKSVTILILIDGFLQFEEQTRLRELKDCHNPYFNRWFSAIRDTLFIEITGNKSQSLF